MDLIFYTIYVCEKIPCKLTKIFEISFDILSKKQSLIKLMAILCKYDEFEKNLKFFDKLMKNKNLLKYFAEIRGVSQAQKNSILKNNVKNNIELFTFIQ